MEDNWQNTLAVGVLTKAVRPPLRVGASNQYGSFGAFSALAALSGVNDSAARPACWKMGSEGLSRKR